MSMGPMLGQDVSGPGLRIAGRKGRFGNVVSGAYERMRDPHNNRPMWCARGVEPVYIFHNGGKRWVISKRVDDGARCYCFIKADEEGKKDPSELGQNWVCCDADGEWRKDEQVSCTQIPMNNDKFAQLRLTLDAELEQLNINKLEQLRSLWKRLDYNGNGIVSLAEIDKMVVELVAGQIWPAWLNNKPALMRAYKKTILKDGDGDDWVEKKEFHALLLNIFWFNKLWQVFDAVDTGDDRRIDVQEFCRGMSILGLNMSQEEAYNEFNQIDTNNGGQVLFVEFCAYIRKRVNPDAKPNLDADIISGENCGKTIRKSHGNKATHTHAVMPKCGAVFDELEAKIKALMQDHTQLRSLWTRIDFNGNNIVSLAEIDKLAVEAYPLLNHKPALMRAYKATIHGKNANDDDWVNKKEFKALLGNLFYFNKIFWMFDQVDGDHDRRMNYKEFKHFLVLLGERMRDDEVRSQFQMVDRNGGGIILFDEFCQYVASKKCPEAFTSQLND